MKTNQCIICRYDKDIDFAKRNIQVISLELNKLLRHIPNDYKVNEIDKRKIYPSLKSCHISINKICPKCYINDDLSLIEDKLFNNILRVLSYIGNNPDILNLKPLIYSCRGQYSKLYKTIEYFEQK